MATGVGVHRSSSKAAYVLRISSLTAQSPFCNRCQVSLFSTTSLRAGRNSDRNKQRGVSALRRTGPRWPSAASNEPLPVPVTDAARRSKFKVNEKHGLWQFFDKGKHPFESPEKVAAHGRPWAVEELRHKSFEDLHCLWWVCVKERNRLITQERERNRVDAGFGLSEFEDRDKAIKVTMRAIKHVLTERWYSYEDARKIAETDPRLRHVLRGDMDQYAFEDEDESAAMSEDPLFRDQQGKPLDAPAPSESRIVKEPTS